MAEAIGIDSSFQVSQKRHGSALEGERQKSRRRVAQSVKVGAVVGATALGYGALAQDIEGLRDFENLPEGKRGANLAGSGVQRLMTKKHTSSAGAGAVGGAVAGFLQGENFKGIAKNALSWFLVSAAFSYFLAIFVDPLGALVALCYLNFHYMMSKFGSKTFREMTFMQKFKLGVIDVSFILLFVAAVSLIILIVIAGYCLVTSPLGGIGSLLFNQSPICTQFQWSAAG